MISIAASFGSVGNLEQAFRDKYASWLILGANHEAVYECYSLESDSGELAFGLGVAVAVRGAMPKALLVEKHQALFVGFDPFVAAVPLAKRSSATVEHHLLKLDGVYVDMVLLRDDTICVIYELGALVVRKDLTKVGSISMETLSGLMLEASKWDAEVFCQL